MFNKVYDNRTWLIDKQIFVRLLINIKITKFMLKLYFELVFKTKFWKLLWFARKQMCYKNMFTWDRLEKITQNLVSLKKLK